ncbi:LOW QUALITY PROTEIN: hypothetical protein HID58_048415 [Brassica napus]|uniref:Uncharacterized protein n=1 Tax=Brassica napus TaxID=3708 RepID=A0ABQ8B213_BRANA|nr:LOW QUALITY PROTEIN: hypothetical protein HID58_048415 [Brassica napus]
MRSCQPILTKPRDGEHTGNAVLVRRVKILLHTPEVQRSSARHTEELARIQEPPCFRRVYPKIFGFKENQFHKLRVSRGQSPQTSMFQEDKFQNLRALGGYLYTSNMTEWKDLRPAKRTRNCRTTRPTKVLLPRSCPIDLEGSNMRNLDNSPHPINIESGPSLEDRVRYSGFETAKQRFTSGCNIYRSSRVRALIPRNLQEKSTGPTGSEHEALESLRFQRRIIRDYEFLHDVRRYLKYDEEFASTPQQRVSFLPKKECEKSRSSLDYYVVRNFSILESGCRFFRRSSSSRYPIMRAHKQEISLITAMRIRDQEFLLPSGAIDYLQQISTDTSDLHQPNLTVLPSIEMQGQDPESP